MENKLVKLGIPGAGEGVCREVVIRPGDTVRSLKAKNPEFDDCAIFKEWDSLPFKEDVDLYEKVRPGSQLYAASYQDVGIPGNKF